PRLRLGLRDAVPAAAPHPTHGERLLGVPQRLAQGRGRTRELAPHKPDARPRWLRAARDPPRGRHVGRGARHAPGVGAPSKRARGLSAIWSSRRPRAERGSTSRIERSFLRPRFGPRGARSRKIRGMSRAPGRSFIFSYADARFWVSVENAFARRASNGTCDGSLGWGLPGRASVWVATPGAR